MLYHSQYDGDTIHPTTLFLSHLNIQHFNQDLRPLELADSLRSFDQFT